MHLSITVNLKCGKEGYNLHQDSWHSWRVSPSMRYKDKAQRVGTYMSVEQSQILSIIDYFPNYFDEVDIIYFMLKVGILARHSRLQVNSNSLCWICVFLSVRITKMHRTNHHSEKYWQKYLLKTCSETENLWYSQKY